MPPLPQSAGPAGEELPAGAMRPRGRQGRAVSHRAAVRGPCQEPCREPRERERQRSRSRIRSGIGSRSRLRRCHGNAGHRPRDPQETGGSAATPPHVTARSLARGPAGHAPSAAGAGPGDAPPALQDPAPPAPPGEPGPRSPPAPPGEPLGGLTERGWTQRLRGQRIPPARSRSRSDRGSRCEHASGEKNVCGSLKWQSG